MLSSSYLTNEVSNVSLKDNGDGTYAVSYHAPRPGKHRVEVALHHSVVPLYWSHIKDSPFRVEVARMLVLFNEFSHGSGH